MKKTNVEKNILETLAKRRRPMTTAELRDDTFWAQRSIRENVARMERIGILSRRTNSDKLYAYALTKKGLGLAIDSGLTRRKKKLTKAEKVEDAS